MLLVPRVTNYNLRRPGFNVLQPSYNTFLKHNSFSYIIANIRNQLPLATKSAPTVQQFLKNIRHNGCQCKNLGVFYPFYCKFYAFLSI